MWLLDCWFVHNGYDCSNFMKQTYLNILMMFIIISYTYILKLTTIITQCLLEQTFIIQFILDYYNHEAHNQIKKINEWNYKSLFSYL
jgi:hypothetical protein